MDLALHSQTFGPTDYSHLVDPEDFLAVGATINLALIDPDQMTAWETDGNTTIPAGTALGIDGSGICALWGTDRVNEQQKAVVDATGGNVTYKFDGETTANISATATASAVQTALELLSNVQHNDIVVTGGPGNSGGTTPYFFDFSQGRYADQDVPALVGTGVSLTGGGSTITMSTPHAGAPGGYDPAGLLVADVRFRPGQRTGKLGCSRLILGAVYEAKLPFAGSDDGTPGKVDDEFIAAPKLQIAYA